MASPALAARQTGAPSRPVHVPSNKRANPTTTTAPVTPSSTTKASPLPVAMPADPFSVAATQAVQNAPKVTHKAHASANPAAKAPPLPKPGSLPPGAVLVFDNARQQVELTVPGPVQWTLFVNEPDAPGAPTVGTATGSSGILVVAYPEGFCGVIQADVLVGNKQRGPGVRQAIDTGGTCPKIPVSPGGGGGGSGPGGAAPPSGGAPGTTTSATSTPSASTVDEPILAFTGVGRGLQGSAIAGSAALVVGLTFLLLSSPRHPRLALARRRATRTFFWMLGD